MSGTMASSIREWREYEPGRKCMPRNAPIGPDTWEEHKERILELYVKQGKKQKEVREELKAYGFEPSKKQFSEQVLKWHRKYKYRLPKQPHQTIANSVPSEKAGQILGRQDTIISGNPHKAVPPEESTRQNVLLNLGPKLNQTSANSRFQDREEDDFGFGEYALDDWEIGSRIDTNGSMMDDFNDFNGFDADDQQVGIIQHVSQDLVQQDDSWDNAFGARSIPAKTSGTLR